METIKFSLYYPTPIEQVDDAYWRAEKWPGLTEHVSGLHIHYEDDVAQVLTMEVNTRGNRASFRSVRYRQRNRIYYFQPSPPPFLTRHYGYWDFKTNGAGTDVTSCHYFDIEEKLAREFAATVLGWDGVGTTASRIGELLKSNSRQTMEALRNSLARETAVA